MSHPASDLPRLDRCVVMGVVNVTPDSFSDGGRYLDPTVAIERGFELIKAGADIVDIGGESTRPGAGRIEPAEEIGRVLPVVHELAIAGGYVSIDTTRAEVATAALDAGARMVNDVSGGRADPAMIPLIARTGVPYVIMHWRGHSDTMQTKATYADVVAEVCDELRQRYEAAAEGGVDPEQIVLDPGLGFAKLPQHNWALLANLDRIASLGRPVLIGGSRKRFLGEVTAGPDGRPRPEDAREDATVAVSAIAALSGAWGIRVHEVAGNLDAVKVAAAVRAAAASTGAPAR